ncbi:polysaccharide deacetylase family protein [Ochrobactrum sp. SFR4]|uniref:polysaccharide deacetylase family protein n=1 Tax=Ochrobactrum sp. SFR4 TaxID=2717368 RepID=UPI001C8B31FF|nr:polysaccharide deacetylase family protein [Ochrobactrum sp. SFR4]MBX8826577.1 polysaccharide deacetylase family protein [Ochrobactrum sp. SFR4]
MNGLHEAKRLLKYSVIGTGLEVIALLRLGKILPFAAQNGLIFTLHHVRPENPAQHFSPNAILSVTPQFLEQAIQEVLQAGMIPVHVHDLPELLANNPENKRYVCFTLDDGYRNNADYAAPIFRRYNIPYTIYITSGFAERKTILWWEVIEQILRDKDSLTFDFGAGAKTLSLKTRREKTMAFTLFAGYADSYDEDEAVSNIADLAVQNGIDPLRITRDLTMDVSELRTLQQCDNGLVHFGAHTVSHINLSRVDSMRMKYDIETSALWLKDKLGVAPQSFSYPYGWKTAVSENTFTAACESGFSLAATTQPAMLNAACLQHPQSFPRVSLNGYFQKKRYVRALISGIPFINT